MKYRIVNGKAYSGIFPITVFLVQKLEKRFFGDKWVNVKAFESYEDAKELLNVLQ